MIWGRPDYLANLKYPILVAPLKNFRACVGEGGGSYINEGHEENVFTAMSWQVGRASRRLTWQLKRL